jgi:hypothetical protein
VARFVRWAACKAGWMLHPAARSRQQENTTPAQMKQRDEGKRKNVSFQKRCENWGEFPTDGTTLSFGRGSRFQKARTIEQQERDDHRTKEQAKEHYQMEERAGQKWIAAGERGIFGVRALHGFLRRG